MVHRPSVPLDPWSDMYVYIYIYIWPQRETPNIFFRNVSRNLARNWSETCLKRSVGPGRCIWTDFQTERTRFDLFRDENYVLWLHCSHLPNLAGWITWMDGLDDLEWLPWWPGWIALMTWMDCLDELDGLPWWTGWIALMNWMDCFDELDGLPWWIGWIALMN